MLPMYVIFIFNFHDGAVPTSSVHASSVHVKCKRVPKMYVATWRTAPHT